MEYMDDQQMSTNKQVEIFCCECGTLIQPNPSNLCVGCLRSKVDITETIPKQVIIYFCKSCEKYQNAPGQWIEAELESRELLTVCLKKLKGLNRVHLIDATFIWTEPHSRRIKVKLTVQKELDGGTILQQTFVVEYVVNTLMCEACHRREAKDFWKAVVQVRQKTAHKKTFLYLEQLLLKYQAHEKCVNVKQIHDGIDFFYDRKDDARKFVDFLQTVVPCQYKTSQQLISHDVHSNTYNYKYTYAVEIVPICKDDIVCLPIQTARYLGNIGQLCVVLRVTQQILLIDPFTLKTAELTASVFFRAPFRTLCSAPQLIEYTVMDIEPFDKMPDKNTAAGSNLSQKHILADVYVEKSSEIGLGAAPIHTRSHLGHLLNPGDSVLGFHIDTANLNEENWEKYEDQHGGKLPDAILVKKFYANRLARNRKRQWKLKRMRMAKDDTSSTVADDDIDAFMEDLEEDPALRMNINIYKDKAKIDSEMAVDEDELDDGVPQITLQEMLDDLTLNGDQ